MILACLFLNSCISAQQHWKLSYELEETALPALHSFAWARSGEDLLIVGGRRDGLHLRQPSLAFDQPGQNDSMYVLTAGGEVHGAALTGLDDSIRFQLSSTNPQFAQRDKYLYFTGGYGYFPPMEEHITYDALLVLDVSKLTKSILENGKINPEDILVMRAPDFAVTGGVMEVFDDHLLLACGHRFDGFYNPANNPTFTQVYHEKILEYDVDPIEKTWNTIHLLEDTLLHRRDFNARVLHRPDGDELVLYSGVFRRDRNMPYTKILRYRKGFLREDPEMDQCLSNYHTAHCYLSDDFPVEQYRGMELFFGGLAGYYVENDSLHYDGDIPFTRHVSALRLSPSHIKEYKSSTDLPGFLGTAAVFVPQEKVDLEPSQKKYYLGCILGGITSDERNVFWSAQDEASTAYTQQIKVYLEPSNEPGMQVMDISHSVNQPQIYPDSDYQYFTLEWKQEAEKLLIECYSRAGKKILSQYVNTTQNTRQKMQLPEELMQETEFILHLHGKEEYWIRVLNND